MTEHNIAVDIDITGRVQGVGYRVSMQSRAESLQLTGWVRNRHDGHVLALAQGSPERVEALLTWCRKGPPAARVDEVRVTPCPVDPARVGFDCLSTLR